MGFINWIIYLYTIWNEQSKTQTTSIDPDDPEQITNQTRKLGLVVIRGTQVSLVSPEEGTEEIANPFLAGDDDDEEEVEAVGTEG